ATCSPSFARLSLSFALLPASVSAFILPLPRPPPTPPLFPYTTLFRSPETLASEEDRAPLEAWDPEALVVVAYGLILPREVLALPRLGCVNIHASILPRWRGAAPIERAILAGDTETGVSIMQMDAGLDTGPVLLQRRLAVSRSHTAGSLGAELSRLGAAALLEALEGLEAGTSRATPQPAEGVTHAAKVMKAEARVDWRRGAPDIERQIRAFNPWPVAETVLDGRSEEHTS